MKTEESVPIWGVFAHERGTETIVGLNCQLDGDRESAIANAIAKEHTFGIDANHASWELVAVSLTDALDMFRHLNEFFARIGMPRAQWNGARRNIADTIRSILDEGRQGSVH